MAEGGFSEMKAAAPLPPPIVLSDEQKLVLADAVLDAHVAVLGAISREAGRADSFDGPRNVLRLTQALGGLGLLLGHHHHSIWGVTTPMFDADEWPDD